MGNYTQIAAFLVNLGVMWLGFTQGQGVYSILWGQLASWFFTAVLTFVWCARLKFLPAAAYTGRPAWDRFYELLAYGWNVFLFLLGAQFINASQTIIIARMLGLEAAAVWSICTRSFSLILQGSSRPFDYSCAALAEMIVRQEKQRLFNRFRSIVIICSSLSVVAGAMFAVCNQPFVHLWTGGKIAWPTVNDALLAIWLFLTVVARCHVGLVGQAKSFGFLRYLYLLEGTFFVAVSLVVVRWGGVTAMLLVSIGGTMLLSLPYGIWRTAKYFQLSPKVVAVDWSRPALRLASLLGPVAAALWWLVRPLSPSAQLVIGGAGTGLLGVWLFFKCGLDEALQTELGRRIPDRLKPWLFSSGQSRGHSP